MVDDALFCVERSSSERSSRGSILGRGWHRVRRPDGRLGERPWPTRSGTRDRASRHPARSRRSRRLRALPRAPRSAGRRPRTVRSMTRRPTRTGPSATTRSGATERPASTARRTSTARTAPSARRASGRIRRPRARVGSRARPAGRAIRRSGMRRPRWTRPAQARSARVPGRPLGRPRPTVLIRPLPRVRPDRRAPGARPADRMPARPAARVPLAAIAPRALGSPAARGGPVLRRVPLGRPRPRFLALARFRLARRGGQPRRVPPARLAGQLAARRRSRCRRLLPGHQARRLRPGQDGRMLTGPARRAGRAPPAGQRTRLRDRRRAQRDGPGSLVCIPARVSLGRPPRQAAPTRRRAVPGPQVVTGCRKGTVLRRHPGPMTGSGSGPMPATAVTARLTRTDRPRTTIPRIRSGPRSPTDRRPMVRPIFTTPAVTVPLPATVPPPATASLARRPRPRTGRPVRTRQRPAGRPRQSRRARPRQEVPRRRQVPHRVNRRLVLRGRAPRPAG
jgi:hypothetical protein